ncbi:MAG: hypothetical protein CME26_03055 [Gemmatimonadetes bacterium]|nr:hypothetical protein [Gemmatimonadota bacterium]|tara:strand:- start:4654 stop:5193 length:540 start_codon:yes stop_codon:yes gene_type:complete
MAKEEPEGAARNAYSIILKERGGEFCLMIPELSIVSIGSDLQAVYDDLAARRAALLRTASEWEITEELGFPVRKRSWDKSLLKLKPFFIKTLCVLLVGSVVSLVTVRMLMAELKSLPTKQLAKSAVSGVLLGIQRTVSGSESERIRKLEHLRAFADRARPFADELWRLAPEDSPAEAKE